MKAAVLEKEWEIPDDITEEKLAECAKEAAAGFVSTEPICAGAPNTGIIWQKC